MLMKWKEPAPLGVPNNIVSTNIRFERENQATAFSRRYMTEKKSQKSLILFNIVVFFSSIMRKNQKMELICLSILQSVIFFHFMKSRH